MVSFQIQMIFIEEHIQDDNLQFVDSDYSKRITLFTPF